MALLYNAPRAATIIAKTSAILFALDRSTFNHIVKNSSLKKREKYENFVKNIDILSEMGSYESGMIIDSCMSLVVK